jgi:hypothetical protein
MKPEERELDKKRAECDALEGELADREVEYATAKIQLRTFETEYFCVVGRLYAELDALEAQIAETEARLRPHDRESQTRATEAHSRAAQSAQALATLAPGAERFEPADSLKKLYREVARRIHPDLATNETERTIRTRLMAKANEAYARGDEAALSAILDEWQSSPDTVDGEGVGAELVRILRKLHQAERRLREIDAAMVELRTSAVYRLWEQAASARAQGRDLLAEMAADLRQQIANARGQLTSLTTSEARA